MEDDVAKVKNSLRDLTELLGGNNGHVLLQEKNVKDCFIRSSYMVKYDRQPIRFNFEFYKPKDEWILFSFSYDTSFDDDIEKILQYKLSDDL